MLFVNSQPAGLRLGRIDESEKAVAAASGRPDCVPGCTVRRDDGRRSTRRFSWGRYLLASRVSKEEEEEKKKKIKLRTALGGDERGFLSRMEVGFQRRKGGKV